MQQATHIYRNGTILTMDSRCSIVSCLAVSGETILAVGSEAEVAPFQGPETRIVDLGGRFMMPGFYDCHSHFMRAGMYNKYYLDVNSHPIGDVRTHGDIRRKVREALSGMPAGEWLLCAGYDDTAVAEERHFTLAELDAMAPDHPLFLRHISGHLALCNSKAFEAAGITDETLNPSGGVFRHDGNGRLTGLVEEPAAMEMVLAASPQMTQEKWLGAVERATDDYVAKGVTTAHDGGVTTAMWKNYMTAHKRGMLKNRVQLLPKHGWFDFSLAPTVQCGTPLTKDGLLSMGAVKLFQDGSLQGYTGYLSNPYHSLPDAISDGSWRGYPIYNPRELVNIVTATTKRAGGRHPGNGAGHRDILNAFEERKGVPRANARHIIIHCQTVREDQLDRIERLGVVSSLHRTRLLLGRPPSGHLPPGKPAHPDRSAAERHKTRHPSLPATTPPSRLWIRSPSGRRSTGSPAAARCSARIRPSLCWMPESVTIWGAYQFHEERMKGSLEPGKLADMVILGENPLEIAPERIRDIPILATLVGNRLVYGSL
ncbi:MAG: amidohydrolase [Bilophila wadsworthia]